MSDRSPAVLELLERAVDEAGLALVPAPDWDDVLTRARAEANGNGVWHGANGTGPWHRSQHPAPLRRLRAPARRRRMATLVLVVLLAGAVIASALASGAFDRFGSWLSSIPGVPSHKAEQDAFNSANLNAPFGFKFSRELREVNRVVVDGTEVRLLGFTANDADVLCLRLAPTDPSRPVPTGCSTRRSLALGGPASLVVGEYQVHGRRSPYRVSFGFAADGTAVVEARFDDGAVRRVPVRNNTFLVVAPIARLQALDAISASGERHPVPFVAPPSTGDSEPLAGAGIRPEVVSAPGRIAWLDRREPRGEPYPADAEKPTWGIGTAEWLRVLRPADALSGERLEVVVAIVRVDTRNPLTKGIAVLQRCSALVDTQGRPTLGGCNPADAPFPASVPLTFGSSIETGSSQTETLIGLASDQVARVAVRTATGNALELPLADNVFAIRLSRAAFPLTLLAFDDRGRVIYAKSTPGAG